jgi:hypothetical protein
MKKYNSWVIASLTAMLAIYTYTFIATTNDSRRDYEEFLNSHPYTTREHLTPEQLKAIPKKDRPDLAMEQDFLLTMDPALGYPTPEKLIPVYQQVATARKHPISSTPGSAASPWVERGPDNVGGRTRAIMFDPTDASLKKVWAGGATGGLWYNNDITSPTSTWTAVGDFWENISITAIEADPTNDSVFYVGTGEGWGSSVSGARGAGIWKSTDAGQTWMQLPATTSYYFVNDLVVRNENGNGVIYAGLRGVGYAGSIHGTASEGIQRSTDGGLTFTQVAPNVPSQSFNYAIADLEIAADNRIWAGTINSSNSGSNRGGGRILYSDNGTTWNVAYTKSGGERVKLATAPSDSAYVYAIIEVGNSVGEIVKTNDHGANWSNVSEPNDADPNISASDFSRNQAWIHLALAVDPNDPNTVIAGSVDPFISDDGGSTWKQLAHWYGGFGFTEVHADQQIVAYRGNSSSEALFGNDGGIYRSTNLTHTVPTFTNLNRGYNVTQFYSCAIHPLAGNNTFLGGTQDNGSQRFITAGINSTSEVTGGDGAYCFIDQTNPLIQITSYVYNSYWLSTNGGISFNNRMQNTSGTGSFINPSDYDDHMHALYSARTSSSINRILNVDVSPSISSFNVALGSMATHLRVSPHTTTSTTLFVGTAAGRVFKITGAESGNPSSIEITKPNLPTGSISCIDVGNTENELLVTYSNYGINSVWYTNDGGITWVSKEGDLPDMPVRWALFNPNNRHEAILATEVGVWSSVNLNSSNPNWSPSTSGLANVRTSMLQLRQSDNEVIAATFGRGMFSSSGFNTSKAPQAAFSASKLQICSQDTLVLTDMSNFSPNSWNWTFSPNTVTFVNGTGPGSKNPEVIFNASGNYQIVLEATNTFGLDSDTMTINAELFPTPVITANNNVLSCTPASGFGYQWFFNGSPIAGATSNTYTTTQDGYFHVSISGTACTLASEPYLSITFNLDEYLRAINFKMYPNPVSDVLNISFTNVVNKAVEIEVLDMKGAVVQQATSPATTEVNTQLPMAHLARGQYLLKIKADNKVFSQPVSIHR